MHRWAVLGVAILLDACAVQPSASTAPSASASGSASPAASRPALSGVAPVSFYHPAPDRVATVEPGQIVDALEVTAPAGVRAWTVVYGSTGLDGTAVAVSGMILAPAEPAIGAHPVVAFAHGTTGIADECAPSRAGYVGVSEVVDLVRLGYVIAATDYEGLGTDGIHPYLVGISEGRSVLDSIRAAQDLPEAGAAAEAVVIGFSQGGQAALWAAQLAPSYAPGLDLLGAMAGSPPTDMLALERWAFGEAAAARLAPAAAPLLLFGVWNDVYGLPLDFLTDEGRGAALHGREACNPSTITSTPYLTDPAQLPDWSQRLVENSPGGVRTNVPMLVVSPLEDQSVQYDTQISGVAVMCAVGDTIELRSVSGRHDASFVTPSARSATTDWIAGRFAGVAPLSTCR